MMWRLPEIIRKRLSIRRMICILLVRMILMTLAGLNSPVLAEESMIPIANNNLSNRMIKKSSIVATEDGYERVLCKDNRIYVEEYSDSFTLTGRKILEMELDFYGGFFSGNDANYFVFGRLNTQEDDAAEVVRVVKYDKNWNRTGAASLTGSSGDSAFGYEIRTPFDYGNVSMAESNGILYIVTGHEGYVDPAYNQGHQGFLMFAVNESSMTGRIVDADLWHSFSQHIAIRDDSHIYVLEESEGSRQTQITCKSVNNYAGSPIPVLKYGGSRTSAWAIPTYATADAIAVSSDSVLAVGTSIDQSRYDDDTYQKSYNIYLTVTPQDNFSSEATNVIWLTQDNLRNGYKDVKLTKLSDDRFLVSWERSESESPLSDSEYDSMSRHVLHYMVIDGHGNVIVSEQTKAAALSECEPVVKNGKVVYFASDDSSVVFYQIDPDSGDVEKNTFSIAGDSAAWSFENGVLTITGNGVLADNLSNGFSAFRDRITTIVLGDGITGIGKNTFYRLTNLQEIHFGGVTTIGNYAFSYCSSLNKVRIPRGVTQIGDGAFSYCYNLRSCYIPKTAGSIGAGTFATGYYSSYSGAPSYFVTIYGEEGSTAIDYAIETGINYKEVKIELQDKEEDRTGSPIEVEMNAAGLSSDPVITYYTDEGCLTETSSLQGAAENGAPPVEAGKYYVKAAAPADDVFDEVTSNTAVLEIHQYETEELENGIAQLRCKACGKTKSGRVPTAYSVHWYWDNYGYTTSGPEPSEVGKTSECRISYISYAAGEGEVLSDFVIELEDPEAGVITGTTEESYYDYYTRHFRYIEWKKAGEQTVTIYPRYNETLKKTFTLNVVKPVESLKLSADRESPVSYDSEITLKAEADGGKGALTYRLVLVGNDGDTILEEGNTSGTFEWQPEMTGTYQLAAEVSDAGDPDEEGNSRIVRSEFLTITVEKAKARLREGVAVLSSSVLVYGQDLQDLTLSEEVVKGEAFENAESGKKIPGSLMFEEDGSICTAGTHEITWVFTPENEYYEPLSGTCAIEVEKADPVIEKLPELTAVTYHPGKTLSEIPIPEGEVSVPGSWSWTSPDTIPQAGSAQAHAYEAFFTPADTDNYNTLTVDLPLSVEKAVPVLSSINVSEITWGQCLEETNLLASAVVEYAGESFPVEGSAGWREPEICPAVRDSGNTLYEITFVPSDPDNYETVTGYTSVTVNRAERPSAVPDSRIELPWTEQTVRDGLLEGWPGWAFPEENVGMELPVAEDQCFTVVYKAEDAENYCITSAEITLFRKACEHEYTHLENQVELTCTGGGYSGDTCCDTCGEMIAEGETQEAPGHMEEILPAVPVSCEGRGLTEGVKCSRCGEILTAQEEIPATGHTEKTLAGRAATETSEGLTEGKQCTICGKITFPQNRIPALGKKETDDSVKEDSPKQPESIEGGGPVAEPITIGISPNPVKVKIRKNKAVVSWKKLKKKKAKNLLAMIRAVHVQYSTDPSFTENVVDRMVGKKKAKLNLKLQKQVTYYVRVRYEGFDGVSLWSGVKQMRTR